jgi:D-serine deaminase-like pyridoxal phosphate-dependent protein
VTQPTVVPTSLIEEARDRVLRQYGSAIGMRREDLVTPALVLDVDAAQRNIEAMAERLQGMTARIRPHIKVHKSPEVARRQVEAGAIGLSTATVWEAAVLAEAGLDDLFVVNTVAGSEKMRLLAELARDHRVLVAVDDAANARELAAAARASRSTLGVMIEIDTGMHRCGVDTAEEARTLARVIVEVDGLRFEGLTGYEGHCSQVPEHDLRLEKQRKAMSFFVGIAEMLAADGIPCRILSAGGTSTWEWTASHPGITEIQAGSYVMMDNFHSLKAPGFEHSLTVQARVISARPDRVIVDAGNKSMGAGGLASIVGHPELTSSRFDEEHGIFAAAERPTLRVGDSVALVPGYSPGTVNWYDAYHVVREDVVVDVWPIVPRGPGHHGLTGQRAR